MDLSSKKCVPCEEGTPPLSRKEAEKLLGEVDGWEIVDKDGSLQIIKKFQFDSYMDGIKFVDKIAKIAEGEDHHPDLSVGYKKVTVKLTTHNIGGLSENDFILAAKIDRLTSSST